jgi:lipopolysaccharide biosynthesis protein
LLDVKPIAFYLPQFHPTTFNDQNWGKGYTEWVSAARATPRFPGHRHPKIPSELGFYDLRRRDVMADQITLAQAYGIHGFCFYYYRFGDTRQLSLPVDSLLSRPHPLLPFCLCWANEDWTRAWDGRSDDVLLKQRYDDDTLAGLVEDFAVAMEDPRYIRSDDRPLLIIYQVEHVLAARSDWFEALAGRMMARIGSRPLIGGVFSHGMTSEMAKQLDFVVQFPPHRLPRARKRIIMKPEEVGPLEPERKDYFERYDDVVEAALSGAPLIENLIPGVCPDWDNSPRRATNAHVLIGSSPEKFAGWVVEAADLARRKAAEGSIPGPFLFINAWNEWAEGATMEPSWDLGRTYLEAFKRAIGLAQE